MALGAGAEDVRDARRVGAEWLVRPQQKAAISAFLRADAGWGEERGRESSLLVDQGPHQGLTQVRRARRGATLTPLSTRSRRTRHELGPRLRLRRHRHRRRVARRALRRRARRGRPARRHRRARAARRRVLLLGVHPVQDAAACRRGARGGARRAGCGRGRDGRDRRRAALAWRDFQVSNYDDAGQAAWARRRGHRGAARRRAPRRTACRRGRRRDLHGRAHRASPPARTR